MITLKYSKFQDKMKIKGGKSKIHNIVDLDTTFNNE